MRTEKLHAAIEKRRAESDLYCKICTVLEEGIDSVW